MLLPRNLNAFYISLIDWAQLTGHPKRLSNPKPNFAMVVGCGLLVVGYWLWVVGCGLLVRMQIGSPVYLTILPKTNNQKPKTHNQKPTTKNPQTTNYSSINIRHGLYLLGLMRDSSSSIPIFDIASEEELDDFCGASPVRTMRICSSRSL